MEKNRLDGQAMNSATVMAALDFINGGPEMPYIPPQDRVHPIIKTKDGKRIGRVFMASTVEDMDKSGSEEFSKLWKS